MQDNHAAQAKRMHQIDIKVQNALTDIHSLSEHFKRKQDEIFKNITRISNVKNDVNIKIDSFANTLQSLHDKLTNSTVKMERDIADMKQTLNEEVKDVRAANKAFAYELERN